MFKWDVHYIQSYRELTTFRLNDTFVRQCLCTDVNRLHSNHRILIDKYCNDIMNTLKTADRHLRLHLLIPPSLNFLGTASR